MEIIQNILIFFNYFFLIYLIIYSTYILICGAYGSYKMYQVRKRELFHNAFENEFSYPMSIIVPAYNESFSILQTIENLLILDYDKYEIIVVDDGSKDNTKDLVIERFGMTREEGWPIRYAVPCKPIKEVYTNTINDVPIVLISKENGGCKADATNAGINIAQYPYIVNMDGDEILQRDSLKKANRAILTDDNVVCVGGSIKMSNYVQFKDAMPIKNEMGKNIIVDMQILEYGRAFIGSRVFQNDHNMNLIVSGGFGIFKRSVVIDIGGFDTTSMGEDMELTTRIHRHFLENKLPYTMKYAPDSVCWTQGPATLKDLRKQRERWYCGLVQTIGKHKKMIFRPKYGPVGLFMLPYEIMYEMMTPFLMIIGFLVFGAVAWMGYLNPFTALNVFLMYFVFGILMSMVSFLDKLYLGDEKITWKLIFQALGTAVIDSLFFRLYLTIIAFFAIFKINKLKKKWESPTRVAVKSS